MMEDYVDVAERVQQFFTKYPEGSLQPLDPTEPYKLLEVNGHTVLVYAAAAYRDPHDPKPGIGMAWELVPGRTPYTAGSELMVAETSAWGRALAALGFATKKIATKEEVKAAESRRTITREEFNKTVRIQPTEPIVDDWTVEAIQAELGATPIEDTHPSCKHGKRIRKSGTNAKGPWVGWYCPEPRDSTDRCEPKFGGK